MSTGKRAENRARQDAAIIEAAERLLATEGGAGLTLRGVAAEVGMVPSAIYRYYPGIDALLTALIIRAYQSIGAAAREADPGSGAPPLQRIVVISEGVRAWALAHPEQYALIYGSPVPGYVAPGETVAYAALVSEVLFEVLRESGATVPAVRDVGLDGGFVVGAGVAEGLLPGALDLFTSLIGAISLELFGHFNGVLADPATHFQALIRRRAVAVLGQG